MLQITRDDRAGRQCWVFKCPICTMPQEFFLASQPFCSMCGALVPPVYHLVDEDDDWAFESRLDYYKQGEMWEAEENPHV